MNIVLYGFPEATTHRLARHYALRIIEHPDQFADGGTGALLPLMRAASNRQRLELYNALLRHEEQIDAVIVCGVGGCSMATMLQYGSTQSRFYALSGTLDEEELFTEAQLILDARFAEGNRLNL